MAKKEVVRSKKTGSQADLNQIPRREEKGKK